MTMRRWLRSSSGLATTTALLPGGSGGESADRGLLERRGHVDAFEVESVDGLLFAVFVNLEVALLEALDELRRSWRRAPQRW